MTVCSDNDYFYNFYDLPFTILELVSLLCSYLEVMDDGLRLVQEVCEDGVGL